MAEANRAHDSERKKRDSDAMSRSRSQSSVGGESTPRTREAESTHDHIRRVLDQALRSNAHDRETANADLAALRQVVDHAGAREFVFDPVMIQMVRTMLERVLHVEPKESVNVQAMYQAVAQTLWDNQPSRERVKRLWNQLRGE